MLLLHMLYDSEAVIVYWSDNTIFACFITVLAGRFTFHAGDSNIG